MASSLDAKISSHHLEPDEERRQYGFTNPDDQNHVREQLLDADAVITGANSMRASGAAWNLRNRRGRYPIWVVLTDRGLDEKSKFFTQTDIPRWLISQRPLPNQKFLKVVGVNNLSYRDEDPARFIVNCLQQSANIATALLFGGGKINSLFYEQHLVDELKLTISPMIIGTKSAANFIDSTLTTPCHLRLLSSNVISSHVFLTYKILK